MESLETLMDRFCKTGLDGFQNNEILELLLSYTMPLDEARDTAQELLKKFKGLKGVLDASMDDFDASGRMDKKTAVLLKLTKELLGVYLKERISKNDVFRSRKDVLDFLKVTLSGERLEKFLAIYLNIGNEFLGIELLYEGTFERIEVHPRKVIEMAFKYNARSVIFVHHHPGGYALPTQADMRLTRVLKDAASAVDIKVYDHLITGGNGEYLSAKEQGWLDAAADRRFEPRRALNLPARQGLFSRP